MPAVALQRARLLAAAGAAAALSGCAGAPAPTVAERGEIAFEMRDFRFQPQAVRARAGAVRVTVVNSGRLPHALRLRRPGRERELLRIATTLPGRRGSARARLARGRYRFSCPIANHEELGMYGVLTVR